MRYIVDLRDGLNVDDIYFCKSKTTGTTSAGKEFFNLTLQDKTGTINAKIWDTSSSAIAEFEEMDFVYIRGEVNTFKENLQVKVLQLRKAQEGDYLVDDYMPMSSKPIDEMWRDLLAYIDKVEDKHYNQLLKKFFLEDEEVIAQFKKSSAARGVHHAFVGGLLEHTLGVTRVAYLLSRVYSDLNRDLLVTSAILHDVGKIREYSSFPQNDFTDEGNLIGHIIIGYEMIGDKIKDIPEFPKMKEDQLKHCILAHHGKLEFGSPKTPGLIEAVALNYADDIDAKLETFREATAKDENWVFSKPLERSIRKTITD